MEVKTRFGTLEATIPEGTKGIYISVSGGMDSATLMYMLCCQIREKKLNIPVKLQTVQILLMKQTMDIILL